jgi:hypothetical protein
MAMCRLAEILDQLLLHLYSPDYQRSAQPAPIWTAELASKLRNWWEDLPPFLKISTMDLPALCPPSHIVVLK